ncbi:M1 family aminopeptidase [Emticicia sp. 17c]|uniref:M1 family aminopeptidase n=1 Tax=Emticicia sp. 17c TaxID=3127704 RepID=UPI00301CB7BA
MNFREIFRFEFNYQLRRPSVWLYFFILLAFAFLLMRVAAPTDGSYMNAPAQVALLSVFANLVWLLMAASITGDAAARDIQTRMYPLIYTTPVSKAAYLFGRFFSAFMLHAIVQLAVPLGILLAVFMINTSAGAIETFRLSTYLSVYVFISLPVIFVATAVQFTVAVLNGRTIASYAASILLLFVSQFIGPMVAHFSGKWEIAKLIDLIGIVSLAREMETWTPIQKNTRLVTADSTFLLNRVLWMGVALGWLAFAYLRFQLRQPYPNNWLSRLIKGRKTTSSLPKQVTNKFPDAWLPHSSFVPAFNRTFGFYTHVRQILAIAQASFSQIAKSFAGLTIIALYGLITVVFGATIMQHIDVPLLPTTSQVINLITSPVSSVKTPLVIVPVLLVFYAGELVWREREARINELTDTTPVTEWSLFLGKLLGLGLIIIVWMLTLMLAGILLQLGLGYHNFEIPVYLQTLLGFQFIEYLLFACLVLAIHVCINHKYIGHLLAFGVLGLIAFAPKIGVHHKLLIFGASPAWSYTDIQGFGESVTPWLWFKAYWTGWSLLIIVVASLLWSRGKEEGFIRRLQQAKARFTRATRIVALMAAIFVVASGGYIFYNTNLLNDYQVVSDNKARLGAYEKLYGKYRYIPQPRITGTNLYVDVYPEEERVIIRGTYSLVNYTNTPIDTIHLAVASGVKTKVINFNKPARFILEDAQLGHNSYRLEQPLQPSDSINLNFEVYYQQKGFTNNGVNTAVGKNYTYFTSKDWLPAIGYQPIRELTNARDRQQYGLPPHPAIPALEDKNARLGRPDAERINFNAVVSTTKNQTAVLPGKLQRKWTIGERQYFHYKTDIPIPNDYALFSANYGIYKAQWKGIEIEIFHHPSHTANLSRMVRGIQAALNYGASHFGSYPYKYLRLIERSSQHIGLHAEATTIDYTEGFSYLNIDNKQKGTDLVFAVVAHEVAHQWWGNQLIPARVEGSPLISEGLAVYTEMQVVEETYGQDQLNRLLTTLRKMYEMPHTRASVPLLRASDSFLAYRKGPFALYAMSKYIGKQQMNVALRSFFNKYGGGEPPLPTTLDLYHELKIVTPDSLQTLLHDFFEVNTFWQFKIEQAKAIQTPKGNWQVILDIEVQKQVVHQNGKETVLPMHDWVEIGAFSGSGHETKSMNPIYLQKHQIGSGKQKLIFTVPHKPTRVGVDPHYLLTDPTQQDNSRVIKY